MLAIVPARGGSKGLPGKNVKPLLGKPLIAYTIEAALKSDYVSEVIVSTDDEGIADIAVQCGAKCPFLRPEELASDESLAVDNYIYTIERISKEQESKVDNFIVLQPTSPLRSSTDIDSAILLFKEKEADSVISYVEEDHPICWHKNLSDDSRFEDIFPQTTLANRQNTRKSYYPNGAIYVFKTNLIKLKNYYGDNSFAYIMPKKRSVDIDYIEDFEYAEFLLRKKNV